MTQPDLLSWGEAQRKANEGMARAVEHADRVKPSWSERALAALQVYCLKHEEFTAEEARAAMHKGGLPKPTDGRAWGWVFRKASNLGWIHRVGYAPRRCGNMTPTIRWASLRSGERRGQSGAQ